jgi:hypothetical protein
MVCLQKKIGQSLGISFLWIVLGFHTPIMKRGRSPMKTHEGFHVIGMFQWMAEYNQQMSTIFL